MVANTAPFFAPLEAKIRTSFLPALLSIPLTEIDRGYRQLLSHSVKQGGLAIYDTVNTAPSIHSASLAVTCHLMVSLVDAGAQFNLGKHCNCNTEGGQVVRKAQLNDKQLFLDRRGRDNPSVARWGNQNCATGAWLSVFPNQLNGTGLSMDKWRDNIHLRYNHSLLDMPAACDGCGANMLVKHALLCKVGSLVHVRHDDLADEWRHLCSTTLSPSQVKHKP